MGFPSEKEFLHELYAVVGITGEGVLLCMIPSLVIVNGYSLNSKACRCLKYNNLKCFIEARRALYVSKTKSGAHICFCYKNIRGVLLDDLLCKLKSVLQAAGSEGVPQCQIPDLVVVDGVKLTSGACKIFGYSNLTDLIGSQMYLDTIRDQIFYRNHISSPLTNPLGSIRRTAEHLETPVTNPIQPELNVGLSIAMPYSPQSGDEESFPYVMVSPVDRQLNCNQDNTSTQPTFSLSDLQTSCHILPRVHEESKVQHVILSDRPITQETSRRWGLLGVPQDSTTDRLYINMEHSFFILSVGESTPNKNYSAGLILENCLLEFQGTSCHDGKNMPTLVMHYSHDISSTCELAKLTIPNEKFEERTGGLKLEKVVVLVSPDFYKQRVKLYECNPRVQVKRLLLNWERIRAHHLLILLNLGCESGKLQSLELMDMLKWIQRCEKVPLDYASFKELCLKFAPKLSDIDKYILINRLSMLDTFVDQSDKNLRNVNGKADSESPSFRENGVVIADLTDPLLRKEEVCCIFEVLLENFSLVPSLRKLAVFSESHLYLQPDSRDHQETKISSLETCIMKAQKKVNVLINAKTPSKSLQNIATITLIHRYTKNDWLLAHYNDIVANQTRQLGHREVLVLTQVSSVTRKNPPTTHVVLRESLTRVGSSISVEENERYNPVADEFWGTILI